MSAISSGAGARVKQGLALVALLLALLWVWHGALLWGGEVLCGGDVVNRFVPMRMSQLEHGWFSPWQPETFSGRPLRGNIESGVYYPPNWITVLWGDVAAATTLLTMLHLVFGAVGFFLLARCWMGVAGAGLAAFLWTFGGAQVLRLTHGVVIFNFAFAWLPWMLLAANRATLGSSCGLRWTALLGLCGGMQLLVGAAQVSQMAWFGVGVWIAARMFAARRDGAREIAQLAGAFAVAGALALALCAPQLAEAMAFQRESFPRGGEDQWKFLSDGSLAPRVLLASIFPEFFGDGALEVLRFGPAPPGRPAYEVIEYLAYWGSAIGYHETVAYLGIAPLLLAAFALLGGRRKGACLPVCALGFLGVFGLLVALGSHGFLFRVLVSAVPTFDYFRVPARWLIWPAVCLAVMAGLGLDRLINACHAEADEEERGRALKGWLIACGAFAVSFAVCKFVLPGNIESFGAREALVTVPPERAGEAMDALGAFARSSVDWALLMALATLAAGAAALSGKLDRRAAVALLLLVALVDLRRFWLPYTESMPTGLAPEQLPSETPFHRINAEAFETHFYPRSELVAFLAARANKGRVHYTETLNSFFLDEYQREFFAERPMAQGIEITRGYQALQLGGYVRDYYASLKPVGEDWSNAFLTQMGFGDRRFLDAYNVTEVLSYEAPPVPAELAALGLDAPHPASPAGVMAWRNPHARGWTWVSGGRMFLDADPTPERGSVTLDLRGAGEWSGTATITQAPAVLHLSTPDYGRFVLEATGPGGALARGLDSRSIELDAEGEWRFLRRYEAPGGVVPWVFAGVSLLALLGMALVPRAFPFASRRLPKDDGDHERRETDSP